MPPSIEIKRTTTADPDFTYLISCLDNELWNELDEDQATYDPFNKVPDIKTAVLLYADGKAIASGCFKESDATTVEVKRMFVAKEYRGRGFSKLVLQELERWAKELSYQSAILETSVYFNTAISLYKSNGYTVIDNYPPYVGLADSVCMRKELSKN